MRIEIWADVACPFCYLGKRRFENALARFPHRDQVEVVYRSFELDPGSAKSVPYDVYDMLSRKYGMSREQAIANNANLARQAAAEGIDFAFDDLKLTNTFDAHRLRHYAGEFGKSSELAEKLYRAYFTDGLNVSDHDTLAQLAVEAGLDREQTLQALAGDLYKDAVHQEEADARSLGIRGVPYYAIDRKLSVSGAQSEETFLRALQQAWDERPTHATAASDDAAGTCDDGSCAID
ncbi:DsbA family oxidoreductase [Cohnella sp. GCM10027633]|uniref:DsbA family oxidoreductase n=1 Tax=unclassified Cohnella TaxID=2636738 RepID=UPI0036307AA1